MNLTKDADRRVREYSLGMRQRLGLALALLNKPQLLILDEPTNGLDPAGIHEMRALIRKMPEEFGVTVFLSSHLLSEVEQIASHIGIIHEGKLLFQGTLAELQNKQRIQLNVGVKQPDRAIDCLVNAGWVVERGEDGLLKVAARTADDAVKINSLLIERRIDVFHLALAQASLEEIFLTLTAEQPSARRAA
jgi:ABC-2 type transport system ATP-binding protein